MKNYKDIRYISSYEAAEVMEKTPRYVTHLCQEGRIAGAYKDGKDWKIPKDSLKNILLEKRGRKPASSAEQRIRPPVIGNTMFREVATKGYYVDKTLMIRDILDDVCSAYLFTRPRRFGKTLNLNMLKTFFEISDEDTSVYFQDRRIWACGNEYRQHQGQYPVIMLTFKDVKSNTWENTFLELKREIKKEVKRHFNLIQPSSLSADETDYLGRLINESGTLTDYSGLLQSLSAILSKCHKSPVVILIDEYDTPIQQGYEQGFFNEVVPFMRTFLSSGLKDNPNLAFGVMTGILRVSKENLFSGLNNLMVNTVLDSKFSSYFGFTEDEVTEMARYYGRTDRIPEIKKWYDGYNFGGTEIYNPWSVNNYFYHGCTPGPYWVNTSGNGLIRELLVNAKKDIVHRLERLISGKTAFAEINMNIIYPELSSDADTVFSFLMLAGYLKPSGAMLDGSILALDIPNLEVRNVFNNEIMSWIGYSFNDNSILRDIRFALLENNAPLLEETLKKYMIGCVSCFDTSSEAFYHGMMLGLLASLSSAYTIHSNRESGLGRYDILMEPVRENLPAVIMELKAAKTSENAGLLTLARTALKQIEDKQYYADMTAKGLQVCRYGMAFCGKNVAIETEMK